jgi:PilZ domain-containing protein
MYSPTHRRRWTRQIADLPVRVVYTRPEGEVVVAGRGTEISEGGMALYAGIPLELGDVMEIEFQMPDRKRIPAVVRNRTGYFFGLEFLTPLEPDDERPALPAIPTSPRARGGDAYLLLRRKELEVQRLRREIQALRKLVPPAL